MNTQTLESPVLGQPATGRVASVARAPSLGWWVARRVLAGLGVLLAVSIIVFLATVALPGDAARTILGPDATPATLAAMRDQLGLNDPLIPRYFSWLGGVLTGDFGMSLSGTSSVGSIVGPRLVNSLALFLYTSLIAIPGSIVLGALLGARRDRLVDKVGTFWLLALLATPDFVVGTLCVIAFATTLFHWFPATSVIGPGDSAFLAIDQMALPMIALSLISAAYLARAMRSSTIEILDSDYIAMARLRGIPERMIIWRHAVPNALVPAVQGASLMLKYLLGGVVIVEFVFNYPGLGTLLRTSVTERDIPTIQAVTLIFAAGTICSTSWPTSSPSISRRVCGRRSDDERARLDALAAHDGGAGGDVAGEAQRLARRARARSHAGRSGADASRSCCWRSSGRSSPPTTRRRSSPPRSSRPARSAPRCRLPRRGRPLPAARRGSPRGLDLAGGDGARRGARRDAGADRGLCPQQA